MDYHIVSLSVDAFVQPKTFSLNVLSLYHHIVTEDTFSESFYQLDFDLFLTFLIRFGDNVKENIYVFKSTIYGDPFNVIIIVSFVVHVPLFLKSIRDPQC